VKRPFRSAAAGPCDSQWLLLDSARFASTTRRPHAGARSSRRRRTPLTTIPASSSSPLVRPCGEAALENAQLEALPSVLAVVLSPFVDDVPAEPPVLVETAVAVPAVTIAVIPPAPPRLGTLDAPPAPPIPPAPDVAVAPPVAPPLPPTGLPLVPAAPPELLLPPSGSGSGLEPSRPKKRIASAPLTTRLCGCPVS
jgi:hypothetical protein